MKSPILIGYQLSIIIKEIIDAEKKALTIKDLIALICQKSDVNFNHLDEFERRNLRQRVYENLRKMNRDGFVKLTKKESEIKTPYYLIEST